MQLISASIDAMWLRSVIVATCQDRVVKHIIISSSSNNIVMNIGMQFVIVSMKERKDSHYKVVPENPLCACELVCVRV